ncbi:MAG: TonB-dependent receptor [Saprospiraceae bacterium]|nr:TonB-dependent receptor [Saprospiraceae bacterium]
MFGQYNQFAESWSQGTSYKEIFTTLEKKLEVHISYPSDLGDHNTAIEISVESQQITSFLNKLFFTLRLEHLFYNNKEVLIRPKTGFKESPFIWVEYIIKEKDSNLPVPQILVHSEDWQHAGYTDENGWVGLKLEKKSFPGVLQLYSFNYEPQIMIPEPQDHKQVIFVKLQENKLPPLTISGKKSPYFFVNQEGKTSVNTSANLHKPLNIFGNDPVKQIQAQAGILAHDDKSTAIKIRGGNEESTLLVIDNMPVYKIDHLLGIFSAVNGDYYEDWKLFKNFIPIQYGGKTGGLVNFISQKSDNKMEGKANINFLFGSLTAKTNFNNKFGIQIGVRKSFNSTLSKDLNNFSNRTNLPGQPEPSFRNRSLVVSQPDFQFYDGQAKIWLALNKKNTINLQGFRSSDAMNNFYQTTFRNNIFLFQEKQHLLKDWNNTAYALSHVYSGKTFEMTTQAYVTKFSDNSNFLFDISRKGPNQTINDSISNLTENQVADSGLKIIWKQKVNQPFTFGGEGILHENVLYMEEAGSPLFEVNRNAKVFSFFGSKIWNLNNSWFMETDLRISYADHIRQFWFLPQLRIMYNDKNWSWQSGISRYKQAVRMLEFENFFGQRSTFFVLSNNTSIPVSESYNSFTSLEWKKGIFSLTGEIYYRKSNGNVFLSRNVAQLLNRNSPVGPTDLRLSTGEGRYYGIDIGMVIQTGIWTQNFQYSLSKSENKFEKLFQNEYFPSIDDSRHQWKLIESLVFDPWQFQTSFIFASGRPYTDVNRVLMENESVNIQDILNGNYQSNLPNYFRWDASVSYTFPLKKQNSFVVELSCFNILNRANVRYRQFFYQFPNSASSNAILGNDISQLGRTFNLSGIFSFASN